MSHLTNPTDADHLLQLQLLQQDAPTALHTAGPRLAGLVTGMQRIAMNSVSHGVTGQNMFLQSEELLPYMEGGRDLFAEWRPFGVREFHYVQKLIDTNWRLNRACAIENNLLNATLLEASTTNIQNDDKMQGLISQAIAYRNDCSGPDAFDKMSRYETRLRRGMIQLEHELTAIQEKRRAKNGDTFVLSGCTAYLWYAEMARIAAGLRTPAVAPQNPATPPESVTSGQPLLCKLDPLHAAVAS